jgi:hypothetical protein
MNLSAIRSTKATFGYRFVLVVQPVQRWTPLRSGRRLHSAMALIDRQHPISSRATSKPVQRVGVAMSGHRLPPVGYVTPHYNTFSLITARIPFRPGEKTC